MLKNKKVITIKARVYPSKFEESKEGWVWLPKVANVDELTDFVRIEIVKKNDKNKKDIRKEIMCEKRLLDRNYIRNHKGISKSIKAKEEKMKQCLENCIFINEYYRNKLGVEKYKTYEFRIESIRNPLIKFFSVPLHHPNAFVRLSMKLGIISLIISLILGGLSVILTIFHI